MNENFPRGNPHEIVAAEVTRLAQSRPQTKAVSREDAKSAKEISRELPNEVTNERWTGRFARGLAARGAHRPARLQFNLRRCRLAFSSFAPSRANSTSPLDMRRVQASLACRRK